MNGQEQARHAAALARVDALVGVFNGAIKYLPMLLDHPDWSDAACLEFARKWDAVARARYEAGDPKWNAGIPYCRNVWKG